MNMVDDSEALEETSTQLNIIIGAAHQRGLSYLQIVGEFIKAMESLYCRACAERCLKEKV